MTTHLVELLIELVELSSLGHLILVHKERWLDLLELAFPEKVESVGDQGLIKVNSVVSEEIASVASNLGS